MVSKAQEPSSRAIIVYPSISFSTRKRLNSSVAPTGNRNLERFTPETRVNGITEDNEIIETNVGLKLIIEDLY